MKTAIILLNYNSFQDTFECVESILKSNEKDYKIIIVDNDSQDDSLQKLKDNFNGNNLVQFIKSSQNLGFSGGCNVGIKEALKTNFKYVLLLNNDTIVTDNFLSEMIKVASSSKEIGIVGGKTLFYDDKTSIWDAGGYICEKTFRGIRRRENSNNVDKTGEVGFVTCCLALVKREVFKAIGLLPEAYFFGSEEWEFSLRAKRSGYKLVYTPNTVIYHKVGRSHDHTSAKMLYNTYRNRILFVKRNYSKFKFLMFLHKFLGVKILQRLLKKGQLKTFAITKAFKIISHTYFDSFKYNKIEKSHWLKF